MPSQLTRPHNSSTPLTQVSCTPQSPLNLNQLPDLSEGTALIRQYFGTVGLMLPCFHEPQIMESFQRARLFGTNTISRTSLAILNVMFALGNAVASTSSPPYNSSDMGESNIYYRRAIALMGDAIGPSRFERGMLSALSADIFPSLIGFSSTTPYSVHFLEVHTAVCQGLEFPCSRRRWSITAWSEFIQLG